MEEDLSGSISNQKEIEGVAFVMPKAALLPAPDPKRAWEQDRHNRRGNGNRWDRWGVMDRNRTPGIFCLVEGFALAGRERMR